MRAITVRQPWAWAIIHGGKNVENRSRNIAGSYRGPVAIHAGKTYGGATSRNSAWESLSDALDAEGCPPWESASTDCRGVIIGVVDLVDAHLVKQSNDGMSNVCFDNRTPIGSICSPWAQNYVEFPTWRGYHLVLANPRPITPIPCRGRLGLWTLPDDIAAIAAAATQEDGERP